MNPSQNSSTHLNLKLWLSAIVAALGSFLFGFDTAVISGTTGALRQTFNLSDGMLGFTVSSALIGTMIGALGAAQPADRWGRLPVLKVLALFFLVSSIGCCLATDWWTLLFFRLLGGVAVGGTSVVSPLYITEIAPPERRGLLVTISQLNIVFGILAAYFSNYLISLWLGEDNLQSWRWMLGVMAAPSLLFLLCVFLIPESPRWLVKSGKREEAKQVLIQLEYHSPAEKIAEISKLFTEESASQVGSLWSKKNRNPLLLALMIAAFNQLDGINAVLYYSSDIFKMAGSTSSSALMQSVMVGGVNLIMTLIAMGLIDRLGRKPLLLIGSIAFVISHLLAAWAFHTHAQGLPVLIAMMGVVASHACSQGAVVWVFINEILPNTIRASGSAAACFLMWSLCAIISWLFPVVAAKSASLVFGFFAGMMILQFILVYRFLPETKGKSLETIGSQWAAH